MYVTVDNHRLNDYAPYMWVSTDFGATFHSIVNNLAGENVRTLTEDQRNRDVLYIGTETGIFLSLDRGKSWQRLKANLPNVRVDEITLHPRDNAMLVATHGRALWILDHLEPIQEYTAAQTARTATPSSSRCRRRSSGRRRTIATTSSGATSTSSARIRRTRRSFSILLTRSGERSQASRQRRRGQRSFAKSAIPAAKNVAGIQTVCWDFRTEPIPPPPSDSDRRAVAAGAVARGGGARRPWRRSRGSRRSRAACRRHITATESVRRRPTDSAAGAAVAAAVAAVASAADLAVPGRTSLPGTYTVALVAERQGARLQTAEGRVGSRRAFRRRASMRGTTRSSRICTSCSGAATAAAIALNALYPQMADVSAKIDRESRACRRREGAVRRP